MRMTCFVVAALALASVSSVHAQRRFRLGPMLSSLSLEDASGTGHGFTAWGGMAALITGDDGETGLTVARYGDLALNSCERSLTLYALDSYYYPVGTRGVAPFASGELGLARVTDADQGLLGLCGSAQPTSQLAIGFGLGVRVNAGSDVAALVEGRFLQVPNSAIQGLEARANVSLAFGSPHTGEFLDGTLGPAASFMIPIAGSLRGRAPFVGVRFRRDTKKTGSVGLQIDYAPLRITGSCPLSGCEESAVLFAPGYEASARPAWGRLYGELGLLLAGVYSEGPDRGLAQGAHGGIGVDLFGGRVMWNLNSRLLWLQRSNGENVFGVQVGVSVSPRIAGSH